MEINSSVVWDIFPTEQTAEIAFNIFSRMDENTEEELFNAIDSSLFYLEDEWTILQAYCTPHEAKWETAIDEFANDLLTCLAKGALVTPEYEEEEWNEQT